MNPIEKAHAGLSRITKYVSWAGLVASFFLMIVTTVDVILRKLPTGTSVRGSYDMTEMGMVVIVFFGIAYFQSERGHVRVDILYSRMSVKGKLAVNLLGDLLFLLPFALYIAWYSIDLVRFAYLTGEASSEMGLTHRWVIKSVLPLAMALLAVQAFSRGMSGLLRFADLCLHKDSGELTEKPKEEA